MEVKGTPRRRELTHGRSKIFHPAGGDWRQKIQKRRAWLHPTLAKGIVIQLVESAKGRIRRLGSCRLGRSGFTRRRRAGQPCGSRWAVYRQRGNFEQP
jgi:hypothetical protein